MARQRLTGLTSSKVCVIVGVDLLRLRTQGDDFIESVDLSCIVVQGWRTGYGYMGFDMIELVYEDSKLVDNSVIVIDKPITKIKCLVSLLRNTSNLVNILCSVHGRAIHGSLLRERGQLVEEGRA